LTQAEPVRREALGWNAFFAEAFTPYDNQGLLPARVAVQHRGAYVLLTEAGELWGLLPGGLAHTVGADRQPVVGDWVAARPLPGERKAIIDAVLPRKTKFSRKEVWTRTEEQVVAANVDTVFLVTALGRDLSLRRLERYLTMAWESGATPAIVLTKTDLFPEEVESAVADIETIAIGIPVHAVSGVTGDGLDELGSYLLAGTTVALLGSSGVGKSTLVNRLCGRELLPTQDVRADGRGRHTTSHRELVLLPGGGLLLDTPGMRELQLWNADDGLDAAFRDLAELAERCRFSNCAHETEPGCAVLAAVESGSLGFERLESYRKLQRELHVLAVKQDKALAAHERRKRRTEARARRTVQY
jgi:ribosome biogenesis GTPase / thiamine phosphate phosphatase